MDGDGERIRQGCNLIAIPSAFLSQWIAGILHVLVPPVTTDPDELCTCTKKTTLASASVVLCNRSSGSLVAMVLRVV